MNQLDLLSIRTFYRQWIHSKASERSGVVISIGPDPILNRLEGPSGKEFYRGDNLSLLLRPQIRRQMRLGSFLSYEKSILGCGLGWTEKKKGWADYEPLLKPVLGLKI